MIIKQIKLKNFKNFLNKEQNFYQMVFIKGKNGSGKSTLALESLLFCLYGYTLKDALKDLPTRSISKSCSVEVELLYEGKVYKITRNYPTKVTIFEDDVKIELAGSSEAQSWINRTFGDRTYFMKFRIVDAYTKETNFLDEGQTTIKKILFSASEETFDVIRKKLHDIKREREIYNKSKAVIYTHYPSQKRLDTLCKNLTTINSQVNELKKDLRNFETDFRTNERFIGNLEEQKKTAKRQRDKLLEKKSCYVCKQTITDMKQKSLLTDIGNKLKQANDSLATRLQDREMSLDLIKSHKQTLDNIESEVVLLNDLKMKLQARIKQKDYKYTDQDVLVVKKAIQAIDSLSTYYLAESVKVLEPLINDVLVKIGFHVSFSINEKEKFTIILNKEGVDYKYKDLSTGEKLLLQIAFKLALLMERGEQGIVIADEGMSSLDSENLQHVLTIFDNLPFQLIFIIHNLEDVPSNIQVINLSPKEDENGK